MTTARVCPSCRDIIPASADACPACVPSAPAILPREPRAQPAPTPAGAEGELSFTAWIVVGAAVALVARGMFVTYDVARLVGGDAYNYQIAALRGMSWVAAANALLLAGVLVAVAAVWRELRRQGRPPAPR